MDTVDRIKELCKERQMNQQALAIAVGIKEDTVSNWFRRKSASFSKYLLQIAEALDTTTEYLLTGNGPKHRDHAYLFMDASGSMAGGKGGQIFGALETLDLGSGEAAAQLDKKEPAPIRVSDSDTKPDWLIKFEELSPGAQKEVIAFIEFKRGQE